MLLRYGVVDIDARRYAKSDDIMLIYTPRYDDAEGVTLLIDY